MLRIEYLAAALAAVLYVPGAIAEEATPDDPLPRNGGVKLPEVTVTASPLAKSGDELIQPSAVLSGSDLDDRRGGTIGETVNQIPGVQSSYFGAGVGRPIIRGLEGSRVQVLEGGISSLDLSGASNDHAVTVDPFLADQVEILKGPSTLLYGPGAIGGVVNIVDGRIPEAPIDGVHGRAQLSGNTVNDEKNGVARIDAGNGEFAVHGDYVRHFADDYDIPHGGTLLNSDVSTRSSAIGGAYTGTSVFAGVSTVLRPLCCCSTKAANSFGRTLRPMLCSPEKIGSRSVAGGRPHFTAKEHCFSHKPSTPRRRCNDPAVSAQVTPLI